MRKVGVAVALLAGGILLEGLWFTPGSIGANMGTGDMMGSDMMVSGMMGSDMMHGDHGGSWKQRGSGYGDSLSWQDMPGECRQMMGRDHDSRHGSTAENETEHAEKAFSQEDVVSIVRGYLIRTKNPNLKIGTIESTEDGDYLVEIVTKDDSLVDKLEVDQFTGWFHSIYR